MAEFELFGSSSCPYTEELRDWLDWKGHEFVAYNVETDAEALERMQKLTGGQRTVPVLLEDGKVIQIGWQGRGCVVKADNK
jgi:glutaredoxin